MPWHKTTSMTDSAWMIRAGNSNELVDVFVENSLAAVGWIAVGDLSDTSTREDIKDRYRAAYDKRKQGRVNTDAAQLHAFKNRIEEGDLVLTYDKDAREYHLGTVSGPYQFRPHEVPETYPHIRPVTWQRETISRDDFTTPAQNTLGGALTVFSLDNILPEIQSLLSGKESEEIDEGGEEPPFIEEVEARSEELISDIIANIDPFDFEELVAAVLRAMGYSAQTTRKGPDYGVDATASPDALGFEDPRMKVQVKHTKKSVGNEDIGRFLGTMNDGEVGLYVSTGGYTNRARQEVKSHSKTITLLDRDEFIDLLLEHYSELEQEYKALVPLKRVYVPTSDN